MPVLSPEMLADSKKTQEVLDSGGSIEFPAGIHVINQTLRIPPDTKVVGQGNVTILTRGPKLPTNNSVMRIAGAGTIIRDISFDEPQPEPTPNWSPSIYGFVIDVGTTGEGTTDCKLENIHLRQCSRGIRLNGGRHFLRNITGQPLITGIEIEDCRDVIRVADVHFWPYWKIDEHVFNFTRYHTEAISSYRNDNPFFDNIFAIHCKCAFHFGETDQGHTAAFKIGKCDADGCMTSILIDNMPKNGAGPIFGTVQSLTTMGQDVRDSIGLRLEGAQSRLSIDNLHMRGNSLNGVRVLGWGNELIVKDAFIDEWNTAGGSKDPGVFVEEPPPGKPRNRVELHRAAFKGGGGAPTTQGNVQISSGTRIA